MAAYLDTGLLLKIYVREPDSAKVLALAQSLTGLILLTRFHPCGHGVALGGEGICHHG